MVKRVLFVNNSGNASFIPKLLSSAGYDINEVYDTGSGINLLGSQTHDLVIMVGNATADNWMMYRKIRDLTACPFIVISPGASAETCVRAIESGVDFFIRKPFGPMELLARINALSQRPLARQPARVPAHPSFTPVS